VTAASLNELLSAWGIGLERDGVHRVKVLRHASNEVDVRALYRHGLSTLECYQQFQSEPVFDECDRLISFIGTEDKSATFLGIYENVGRTDRAQLGFVVPTGPPELVRTLDSAQHLYTLIRDTQFDEFRDNLRISWGDSPKQWHQWLPDNDKVILSTGSQSVEGAATSRRNPAWSRDELILALDLYFRFPHFSLNATHPEVASGVTQIRPCRVTSKPAMLGAQDRSFDWGAGSLSWHGQCLERNEAAAGYCARAAGLVAAAY
jgi:hypothetical protein